MPLHKKHNNIMKGNQGKKMDFIEKNIFVKNIGMRQTFEYCTTGCLCIMIIIVKVDLRRIPMQVI